MLGASAFRSVRSRLVLSAAFVAVAALVGAGPAQATQYYTIVPAQSGHAWQAGDVGCFSNVSFSNGITNTCARGAAWMLPLPLTVGSGASGLNVYESWAAGVKQVGGSAPTCRVIVRDTIDSSVYFGSAVNITNNSIPLGSTTVNPTFDTVHLDCWFNAAPTQELTYFQGFFNN